MTEPRSALSRALLLACALACEAARAQPAPRPSDAAASAAERAQKESDRTMYWIRVLADKPAPAKAAPAPKPVTAAAAPSARSATEAREKAKVAGAPTPAATSSAADAANVVPAPVAVAQASDSAQAPVGDAPDPTALSSSSADNVAAAVAINAALPHLDLAPAPAAEPDPGLINVKLVQPNFPSDVVQRIRKGNVEVRFEVEPGGTVVNAAVVESSHPQLNNAAVKAIRQWRFKPTPLSHAALVNLVFNIDAEN
jgi:TonB family protein